MNTLPRFIILSAHNPKALAEALKLANLSFKQVLGSYKGTTEDSFVVIANEDAVLSAVKRTAFADGQESVLVVNEDRESFLEFADGTKQALGSFQAVSAERAAVLDGWTLDGTQYYSTIN